MRRGVTNRRDESKLAGSVLRIVLPLALVLALVTATASLLGSSQHLLGATSASGAESALDDHFGDGVAVAVVPQPLLLVALLAALALVALPRSSATGAAASEPRRARAPPAR